MGFASGIKFDDSDFQKRMGDYNRKVDAAKRSAMMEVMLDWEKHAKLLAPKEEGHLEGGIAAQRTIQRKGAVMEGQIHAGTDSLSAAYALRIHESMTPAIPSGDSQFQPGPITLSKPSSEVGVPGGKYITRPAMHFGKKWMKHIATAIRKIK